MITIRLDGVSVNLKRCLTIGFPQIVRRSGFAGESVGLAGLGVSFN